MVLVVLLMLLATCNQQLAVSQSIDGPRKAYEQRESRIIVRYAHSDGRERPPVKERVKHLEAIQGVVRAEALPHLDMAVVICDSEMGKDSLLEVLDGQEDVELAIPDTWVQADVASGNCSAHSKCAALGLHGQCCPTSDRVFLSCCDTPKSPTSHESDSGQVMERSKTTIISLETIHGSFLHAHSNGKVGMHYSKLNVHTHFNVVSHTDGTISLKSHHGAYLVGEPTGSLATWTRPRVEADDWEKFHIHYNNDGTVSLRSKSLDRYMSAGKRSASELSVSEDEIGDWEKFTIHVQHGEDTSIPNDANFSKLWGMDHWGDRDIDAVEAWKKFNGSSQGIVLAVIDTGIDYTHPDLKDQMWVNPNEIPGNGIDDDQNGIVDDVHGADFANNDGDPLDDQMHGTHCAGTIAGKGNNGIGVAGVAWQGVRLMALKFLSAEGGGRTSDAVKALNYAVAMGARLTSNSWGGGGSSSAMRVAIERAERAGMLFVAAAGNEGSNNDETPHFPSNYASASIISVASTTFKGTLSSFSCYGAKTVDVAAPGSAIYSTVPGGKYRSLSGTSMATPHVSGLAALIWMYRPKLAMQQVKDIVMKSVVVQDTLKGSSLTNGRINALRALELASTYEAPKVPSHAPRSLEFHDVNPAVGIVSGTVTVTAAADESDVDFYSVHWVSSAGFLMGRLGQVNATGTQSLVLTLNGSVAVPMMAKGLAAVAGNADGEAGVESGPIVEVEDYGVPESGAQGVSWAGDFDGRASFVAGTVQIKRARNERTISHYNVYWHQQASRGNFLGKVPSIGFLEPSCSGSCDVLNQSNANNVYNFHRDPYSNNELAVISFSGPARVTITHFITEKDYDFLEIGSRKLTGQNVEVPFAVELPAGPQTITWSSDSSETEAGWTFHLQQLSYEANLPLPVTQLNASTVEVVAAYHGTESLDVQYAEIVDFDASSMPPSQAFVPSSVQFKDADPAEHSIRGVVKILPARSHVSDIVIGYRIFLADLQGRQVGTLDWKASPAKHVDAAVQVEIASSSVPSDAASLVVRPISQVGESLFGTSVELVDLIRSAPAAATFSGDVDLVEGQIEGNLTIQPAANPTGIIAYAVYMVNGTHDRILLGRIAAMTGDAFLVFRLHAYFETGQNLLVVSVYASGPAIKEGIQVQVQDAVGKTRRMGGSVHPESQQHDFRPTDLEPWLQKSRAPVLETLWTLQQRSRAALPLLKAGAVMNDFSDAKVLSRLTVHGFLRSSKLQGNAADQHALPPTAEERDLLRTLLAQALPGSLHSEQVLLRRGHALADAAGEAFGQAVSLVVDFEVLPAFGPGQQAFLDRVEARIIQLSQGGHAASRFEAALSAQFPERHLQAKFGEPQQVAPKMGGAVSHGRWLAAEAELPDDGSSEQSGVTLASLLAVLGSLGAVGSIAGFAAKRQQKVLQSTTPEQDVDALESIVICTSDHASE
eukprot:TRINITY_DN32208_c0_g1_i1.p1 TRINITY_DN32208_c0_g1~~TRINITY_DN32208_c0_g1_i1.p1  ORF type:complete len:1445 (-),score=305.46 TRINITY_DN32208_c0_g1_i1:177-4511(-)